MSQLDLQGQVAIVTGAGRGIGQAIAGELARAGSTVVAAARTVSELEETAASVRGLGRECLVVPTDLTDEAACRDLVRKTEDRFGRLDLLVNNAGAARFAPVWELTAADFDLNLNVNLKGTFYCSQAAIRAMMLRRRGCIVNIASSSGKKQYPEQGAYCAAKAGVIALSKVMALELRPFGIKVHVICPGAVDTRLADEIHPGRDRTGWIQPADVAAAVLYLLSAPPDITTDELMIRRFQADPL